MVQPGINHFSNSTKILVYFFKDFLSHKVAKFTKLLRVLCGLVGKPVKFRHVPGQEVKFISPPPSPTAI